MVLRQPRRGPDDGSAACSGSASRLYPLVKAACPDHPLLRETRREVLDDLLDAPRPWPGWRCGPAVRFRRPRRPVPVRLRLDRPRRGRAAPVRVARRRPRAAPRAPDGRAVAMIEGGRLGSGPGGSPPRGRRSTRSSGPAVDRRRPPRLRVGARRSGATASPRTPWPRPWPSSRPAGPGRDRSARRGRRPGRVAAPLPADRRGPRAALATGWPTAGSSWSAVRATTTRDGSPPLPESLEVDGWTIAHGHRPIKAARTITGHHHPVLRSGGLRPPASWSARGRSSCPPSRPTPPVSRLARPGCPNTG